MLFPEHSYKIMGACFEVHNRKGCGFLEPVYQECLQIEFAFRELPVVAEPALHLTYRGRTLKQKYKPDFICFERIIVEIKAVDRLTTKHEAQVINYLNATEYELGILVNFGGHPQLEYKRLALSNRKS